MTVYGITLPGALRIARSALLTDHLTERARYKLKVLDWHRAHGQDVSWTARHFGLGRMTVYRWLKELKHGGPVGLNERSRRPKKVRAATTSWDIVIQVIQLRKQYPAWSKYKLQALLAREGIQVSVSTVGRILKRRGLINQKVSRRQRRAALHPKARFPKGLRITEPGDLVQIDIKHIMLPGGRRYYQFTAIDVLSKIRVLRVYPSESSRNGAHFLTECFLGFPFLIKAVQTDNGSTFLKEFEKACKERHLPHYFIYPRTPKQNSYVEISHGADEREFYQQGMVSSLLPVMQERIKEWEHIWNTVRPHQSLNYLTSHAYREKLKTSRLPTKNVIILQT